MIVHVDMDAFFASVEQMDNPALRGRPVMVGGGDRGVVATASYEARRFGVHSAMPAGQARRLCPQGVFVRPRFDRYKELSGKVMEVLRAHSPLVEQASIDEAYLDAEGLERVYGSLPALVCSLRCAIRTATGGLTCSVGVAPVKFLAKICSDVNKPDGVFILETGDVEAFLATLPVRKIPGVGQYYAAKIVKYRSRLGGFTSTEQLKEIKGLPDDITRWVTIGTEPVSKLAVNQLTFGQLLRHPYLNFEQVRAIMDHRKYTGPIR
ncbi:MAG: helix-hairpin-helix domain-containing protein, partial [Desulfovibrio sp.]|nr:helix-hairpin-helix domain-containing protein [Desulfovibrio sp.]